jgi:hypothetical protein
MDGLDFGIHFLMPRSPEADLVEVTVLSGAQWIGRSTQSRAKPANFALL